MNKQTGCLGLEIREVSKDEILRTEQQLSDIAQRDNQTLRPFDRKPKKPLFNINDWRD